MHYRLRFRSRFRFRKGKKLWFLLFRFRFRFHNTASDTLIHAHSPQPHTQIKRNISHYELGEIKLERAPSRSFLNYTSTSSFVFHAHALKRDASHSFSCFSIGDPLHQEPRNSINNAEPGPPAGPNQRNLIQTLFSLKIFRFILFSKKIPMKMGFS